MHDTTAPEDLEMFPYAYVIKGRRTILVWQTSSEAPDSFKLDSKGSLVSGKTEQELKKILGAESKKVKWSDVAELNFDKFWNSLRNLRLGRASSKRTCKLLLDGWNFLEDLGQTFGLNKELENLRTPLLNKVYDKLFSGSNLPSMTPEGRSYSPHWSQDEIYSLRKEFKKIWNLFRDRL
jgi:hypothetical protein